MRLDAGAVQVTDVSRFRPDVEGLRGVKLHAIRQPERLDPRLQLLVLLPPLLVEPFEPLEEGICSRCSLRETYLLPMCSMSFSMSLCLVSSGAVSGRWCQDTRNRMCGRSGSSSRNSFSRAYCRGKV